MAGGLMDPLTLLDPRTKEPKAGRQERDAALAGLHANGFVRISPDFAPARLAVVLTGGGESRDTTGVLPRLAARLDRGGAGAVLAGRSGSAEGNAAVGIARADTSIAAALSTVDNAETTAGRVATSLALEAELRDRVGHYGSGAGAEGQVPERVCGEAARAEHPAECPEQ
ncbi:hypothetical protein J2S53_000769 [Actinopolyspora lacussalsi]|nr:hypothetical protein [Actinopolyspora lacussalsi]